MSNPSSLANQPVFPAFLLIVNLFSYNLFTPAENAGAFNLRGEIEMSVISFEFDGFNLTCDAEVEANMPGYAAEFHADLVDELEVVTPYTVMNYLEYHNNDGTWQVVLTEPRIGAQEVLEVLANFTSKDDLSTIRHALSDVADHIPNSAEREKAIAVRDAISEVFASVYGG